MAALTSTISLLEVPVAHFVDYYRWPRMKAVLAVTGVVFTLAVPSALGNGALPFFTELPVLGLDFLTLMATVWNNFSLPVGGLLTALFVGWVWRVDRALEELLVHEARFPATRFWSLLIRWIWPVGIFSIILVTILAMFKTTGSG